VARLTHRIVTSPGFRRARKRLGRYRRRSRFFYRARRFTPYLGADVGAAMYIVSSSDKNIGRCLVVRGRRKEHRHLALALAALENEGISRGRRVLLDVGANIGTTAIAALVDHGFERVLAFEPAHENFRLLRANTALNELKDRMQTFEVAVSDEEGSAILDVSSANAASHWLVPGGSEGPGRTRVPTARLDRLLDTAGIVPDDVDLLWIDVEGHEGHVLAGARSLLTIGVPTVFELSPRHLDRSGGLGLLLDNVQRSFTHLLDLRCWHEGPLPTSKTATLLERYKDYFTDVLAYRSG